MEDGRIGPDLVGYRLVVWKKWGTPIPKRSRPDSETKNPDSEIDHL